MNKIKFLVLCLLLSASVSGYAQKKETDTKTFKYGKVDPAEFETKVTGTDSAAAAVALFDVGNGRFEINPKTQNFMYVFERHTRYKIINKNGYDYANMEIPVYNDNGAESVLQYMDGATYNMENGKMEISKLNKDARFSEKKDKNVTIKKFTLPNVKEGSIIEFKYSIKSDFIFTLRPWYFQKEIPVLFSRYTVQIPDYLMYKSTPGGFIYLNPTQENVNDSFMFTSGERLEAVSKKIQYTAENVPGLKSEGFITTMEDYISKIEFELGATRYPGQVYKSYTNTWPSVIKMLKDNEYFGVFANKRSYSRTLLQSIVKQEKNPDTVVQLLFNYVKNNIKSNDEDNKYTDALTPKSVFEKKSGNSAEINLCLYTLLKEADINVSPVLLSTRRNGVHPGLPMMTKFDNVILMVTIGEKSILLDATDKNNTPGLISYSNLNHQGFKIDLDTEIGEWVSLESTNVSRQAFTYNLTLNAENKFTGKLYISSSEYEGVKRRNKYQSETNQAEFLKSYKANKPGLSVKNYEITNLDKPELPLVESMDVEIEDNLEEAGNLAYFMPLLFERTKENPFKLEERKYPVDFAYPFEETFRISVELPAGYQIDKTPKNERIVMPDKSASFAFMFMTEENMFVLSSKIIVNKAVYTPEEYQGLKELFKNIVRKQSEQVVLKKI